uniref:G0/G1 switch 2 n=1 Tax=Callorhinchus milii TaxID=7868 RepID=V9LCY4_CALMI|eukprot:gi/632963215/ref/XP_007897757.1/ PREDICTED: G0/G1 switch protein 2 [Callorhinchus milii]
METMNEIIPFAKELLSQKPNRKMLKLYLVGSVLTFFGVVIGLVETVCQPFISHVNEIESESEPEAKLPKELKKDEERVEKKSEQCPAVRNGIYRKHAS